MDTNFLVLTTICFVGMISPGPDFILVTKNALIYSRPLALATALGVVSGCFVHATYCVLGLALVITKSVVLYSAIRYLGACYLIYLGVKGLRRQALTPLEGPKKKTESKTFFGAYIEGLLCNVLNPKLAVFLLSLFTQFISVHASIRDKLLVCVIFIGLAALYWPLLVLFFQSKKIRGYFINAQTFINRLFGTLLIILGVHVIASVE
jgi:threonine/homoserine/homoserine lactone efflux protein